MFLKLQIVSIEMKDGEIWISCGKPNSNLFTYSNYNYEVLDIQAEYNSKLTRLDVL